MTEPTSSPTVVLVHGAFADASGWAGVLRELQADGLTVLAPPNPLRQLSGDADAVAAFVGAIDGPVLLVGHSYGGAVITRAATELPNVVGLVYVAAFGLDEGETVLSVQAPFPPTMLAQSARPSSYPAPGAVGGPDLFIDHALFRETFCADVPVDQSEVLFATQRPVAAATLDEPLDRAPAWRDKPSWYLVSRHDRTIDPATEAFMAERMGATTETIDGSHLAFVSQPVAVATFIRSALAKLG
jgi:pimeloyl-ACP methyl ester carboxylesterase